MTLAALVAAAGISLTAAERTVTGLVVKNGSDYTLTANGTIYAVKASAKQKAQLNKLIGKVAVVRGDVEDTVVTVTSVKKEKKLKKH